MANETEIVINLKAIENLTGKVNEIEKRLGGISESKGLKRLGSSFTSIAVTVTAVNQGLQLIGRAYNALARPIQAVVAAAAEQEKVETLLISTLKQKGVFTQELTTSTLAYASALQRQTTFGDESIIAAQRLLIQYGVTTKQLNNVTKATLDFAAATGMDLQSSAALIGRTVGTSTNALSRYGIEMGKITDAGARAEVVISKINKLFGGAAAAEAQSFAGIQKQITNLYGDLYESIGLLLIRNEKFLQIYALIRDGIAATIDAIERNKEVIGEFVTAVGSGVLSIIKNIDRIAVAAGAFISALVGIKIAIPIISALALTLTTLPARIVAGQVSVKALAASIKALGITAKVTAFSIKALGAAATLGLSLVFADIVEEVYSARDSISSLADVARVVYDRFRVYFRFVERTVVEALRYIAIAVGTFFDKVARTRLGRFVFAEEMKSGIDSLIESMDALIDKQKELVSEIERAPSSAIATVASAVPGVDTVDSMAEQAAPATRVKGDLQQSVELDIAKSITAGVAKGADGAKQSVAGALTLAATAVLGPLGAAAAPLLDMFVQGPEHVKMMVDQFVAALPEVIKALVDGAIAFVFAVIDNLPNLIDGLIAMLPELFDAIIKMLPQLSIKLVQAIVKLLPQLIARIVKIFADAVLDYFSFGLLGGVTSSEETAKSGTDFGVGAPRAATGLDVPMLPQFRNDRFPANLSAGESVITAKTTDRLARFLDKAESGGSGVQNVNITLQVGERELASVLYTLNQRGFRTA